MTQSEQNHHNLTLRYNTVIRRIFEHVKPMSKAGHVTRPQMTKFINDVHANPTAALQNLFNSATQVSTDVKRQCTQYAQTATKIQKEMNKIYP